MKLKSSFFNVLVPVEEEHEYLLYNTLSGGLEVLSYRDGKRLEDIIANPGITYDPIPDQDILLDYLYRDRYLVSADMDEKQKYLEHYLDERHHTVNPDIGHIGLTIGTTITCNMGCPYCFEFDKPNKTLKDDSVIDAIVSYIEGMIARSPVKTWSDLYVTWYGGEPLINYKSIEKLTPRLKQLCSDHGLVYDSFIITNGLLLTDKVWKILKDNDVKKLQVTIDGAEETHNLKRPVKIQGGPNYKRILENLSIIPEGMDLTIRINVDKKVAAGLTELLDDLQAYGVWPQKYKQVKFSASWLRPYTEITNDTSSEFYTNDEFFDVLLDFKMLQMEKFNEWAAQNGVRQARLRWLLPSLQQDCAVWVSPYDVVVDPEGYLQKCWETIHDSRYHIRHISEGFDPVVFDAYSKYNRVELNQICANCNIMPVCERLSCSFEAVKKGKPECTYWKTRLPDGLKRQYLMMKHNPDLIAAPEQNIKKTSHATNK